VRTSPRSPSDEIRTLVFTQPIGGGGISLAWGSSTLAVRETLAVSATDAAVIGGGIMGHINATDRQPQLQPRYSS
jgi:hypothetical protein